MSEYRDDNDIDHLHEARQHAKTTPYEVDHYLQRGQVHALIAIAEELRKMNEKPKSIADFLNRYTPEQRAQMMDIQQGDYQSHVYPFGRQP